MLPVDFLQRMCSTVPANGDSRDYEYISEFYVTKALQRRSKSAGMIRPVTREVHNVMRPRTAIVRLTQEKHSPNFEQCKVNAKSFDRAAKRSDRALRIYKTRAKSARTPTCSRPNKDGGGRRSATPDLSVTGVCFSELVSPRDAQSPVSHSNDHTTHSAKSSEYGWAIDRLMTANYGNSDKWASKKSEPTDKNLSDPAAQLKKQTGFVGSTRYADIQKRKSMLPSERRATPMKSQTSSTKENKSKYEELEFSRNRQGSLIRIGRGAFGVVYQVIRLAI